jgi:SNF2 family DNA or RNA helicase
MGFSVYERQQSEGRAHRIGQERKVTYVDLVVKNSIDEIIIRAIKENVSVAKVIVEWWKNKS